MSYLSWRKILLPEYGLPLALHAGVMLGSCCGVMLWGHAGVSATLIRPGLLAQWYMV